ncbi:phosphate ABC transporter permease PstA [Candidatus Acetothermia bacterium]|nr:phosphate ABC transporter permease PstA [Candidatus Acetothermia bacterium]MBI3643572.1 phosphate ABC transporter permease PstA [Candidatus Acetothermia bacterium]
MRGSRYWVNHIMHALCMLATLAGISSLFLILGFLVIQGVGAFNWDLFTQPESSGLGISNGIIGTIELVALASLLGVPIGVMSGLFLSEYGRRGRFGNILRFFTDILNSTPSIVVGVFGFAFIVVNTHHFSALAGAFTLMVLMIPIITRSTEEIALLVPNSLREAALALGVRQWKVILFIVMKTARAGIITGILLSVARVAGETAPLVLTALGNLWPNRSLTEPIAALPLEIYNFATGPDPKLWSQAWAACLILVLFVTLTSLLARLSTRRSTLRK